MGRMLAAASPPEPEPQRVRMNNMKNRLDRTAAAFLAAVLYFIFL